MFEPSNAFARLLFAVAPELDEESDLALDEDPAVTLIGVVGFAGVWLPVAKADDAAISAIVVMIKVLFMIASVWLVSFRYEVPIEVRLDCSCDFRHQHHRWILTNQFHK